MNILIAPNSMKGSIGAGSFARAVETGFRNTSPAFELRMLPIADGGDGTGEILAKNINAQKVEVTVSDPHGRNIETFYWVNGTTAIIEMASASGLNLLLPAELNPLRASSRGLGQLLQHAIDWQCTKIIVGVGGSATVDGGIGMLGALGFTFFDAENKKLEPIVTSLVKVAQIMPPKSYSKLVEISVLCDVLNPLLGNNGAAVVFGPQKGATSQMVQQLENSLRNWIGVLEKISGKELRGLPGMGAAGGVSSGLVAFFNAELVQGADFVFETLQLDNYLDWADWVITGEGKIDSQSLQNKAPVSLARRASQRGKPCTAIAGIIEPTAADSFAGVFSICNQPLTKHEAMANAEKLCEATAAQIARLLLKAWAETAELDIKLNEVATLLDRNEIEPAEELLETFIGKRLSAWYYLKGLAGQKKQNWGQAINAYFKCIEIDPENAKAAANIEIIQAILSFTYTDLLNP